MTELSHTVYFNFDAMEASVVRNCDNRSPITVDQSDQHESSLGERRYPSPDVQKPPRLDFNPEISSSVHSEMDNEADRMLVQAEGLSTEFDFRDMLHLSDED